MFKRKITSFKFWIALVLGLGLLAGLWFTNSLRDKYVLPIIMYHEVFPGSDPGYGLAVSTATFERQMAFLKRHSYNVMPLSEAVGLIREKKKFPPRAVVITFDDGYRNNYAYAFPILKKYGLSATLFIIVNEVGRRGASGERDRLSWDEIKEMQESGLVTIGSHALGPDPLIKINSPQELKRQISGSKSALEERLGRKIDFFSYPEGMFDGQIRQMVINSGYKAAVATNPGPKYPNDDLFALKRIRISENASNMFVFAVETSGYYTFMKEYKKRKNAKN